MTTCLIKNCDLPAHSSTVDVRFGLAAGANQNKERDKNTVSAIGLELTALAGEDVIDANGGALLPGLHDHHIHLVSLAASLRSVHCGPPEVNSEEELAFRLEEETGGQCWLRGIGYHTSVAGNIDRHWLDRHIPLRPVRIQHRGGRLWLLNSAGLEAVGITDQTPAETIPAGVEREHGSYSGRLYECDKWLQTRLDSQLPGLQDVSALLASFGVTGVTDTTPHNGVEQWQHFQRELSAGRLLQDVRVMGDHSLPTAPSHPQLCRGEYKIHLLESQLPEPDALCSNIRKARDSGRQVAIHCVTSAELAFALACLEYTSNQPGDRIEHASVAPDAMYSKLASMGLRVVTQPHFIAERGDRYLAEVAPEEQPWLYRLKSFISGNIALAGGSDAPFGSPDPWRAMAAAVTRKTASGQPMDQEEALSPEQALALFTSDPAKPGVAQRRVTVGSPASLCLLARPWREARNILSSELVRHTWNRGRLIY